MAAIKAMILAAGLGKRMRDYAPDLPKPLVKVAGTPLIDYSFRLLKNAAMHEAVVNTHYLAEKMEAHLAAQSDLRLTVSREDELLETGGGVMKALPQLDESFFVLNSDVICEDVTPPVLQQMQARWDSTRMDALLLIIPVERAVGYRGDGDFKLNSDGSLASRDPGSPAYVFTGVQLLHRRFLAEAPVGPFSLSMLYKKALKENPCRLHGIIHPGRWFHVGDGEGVREASALLA